MVLAALLVAAANWLFLVLSYRSGCCLLSFRYEPEAPCLRKAAICSLYCGTGLFSLTWVGGTFEDNFDPDEFLLDDAATLLFK